MAASCEEGKGHKVYDTPEYGDLVKALARGELMVVVGSGVSVGLTWDAVSKSFPRHVSWVGLLQHGAEHGQQYLPEGEREAWRKGMEEHLAAGRTLEAAGVFCELMQRRLQPVYYARWLTECFSRLTPDVSSPLAVALRATLQQERFRVMVATTNYDGLLEQLLGAAPLHPSDSLEVLNTWVRRHSSSFDSSSASSSNQQLVFHFHGHWSRPADVVLDPAHYQLLLEEPRVQAVMNAFAVTKTVLFVGCGAAGLTDPNWGQLLARCTQHQLSTRYALCHAAELPGFATVPGLVALDYGPSYTDLAPFLQRLAADAASSLPPLVVSLLFSSSSSSSSSSFSSSSSSTSTRVVGRLASLLPDGRLVFLALPKRDTLFYELFYRPQHLLADCWSTFSAQQTDDHSVALSVLREGEETLPPLSVVGNIRVGASRSHSHLRLCANDFTSFSIRLAQAHDHKAPVNAKMWLTKKTPARFVLSEASPAAYLTSGSVYWTERAPGTLHISKFAEISTANTRDPSNALTFCWHSI
ncbi:MAG: SIR2 family protein [archaeon]|nr:SIR2 family protein [archaeon]